MEMYDILQQELRVTYMDNPEEVCGGLQAQVMCRYVCRRMYCIYPEFAIRDQRSCSIGLGLEVVKRRWIAGE